MANEITFELNNKEAENLWKLLSTSTINDLDPSPSVPFALYELRKSLDELRQVPEDEDSIRPQAQMEYCKAMNLSRAYFPKTEIMEWTFEQRLLVILKLVLKWAVRSTSGEGVAMMLKLCETLSLRGWFMKNFKKPLSIDLGDDDCDLDDELDAAEVEPEPEAEADQAEAAD